MPQLLDYSFRSNLDRFVIWIYIIRAVIVNTVIEIMFLSLLMLITITSFGRYFYLVFVYVGECSVTGLVQLV